MTYMMAFGGGILAPFLLGKPPVMFVNDLIVPMVREKKYRFVTCVPWIVRCPSPLSACAGQARSLLLLHNGKE